MYIKKNYMYYPTPPNLPPPEEVEQSKQDDEALGQLPPAIPNRDMAVAGAAALIAFTGTYTGSQMLTLEKQDAYRDYHNTLGALTDQNTKLYDKIADMPSKMRVTHEGKEISAKIDAINTQIADTKYEYSGGIHPAFMSTASTFLGVIAAGAATLHYIGSSPRLKK